MARNLMRKNRLALALWFRLARFYQQSNRASTHHLSRWCITLSQFDTLVQISVFQPVTQNQLAEKLFVTKGNMTHTLSKLEGASLIERTQEWRTKTIELTELGENLIKEVLPDQSDFQASQFAALTVSEQKQLLQLLRKLHRSSIEKEG
ncbi:MarR family transcriptional regulator [Bacillus sp. JCM 19041]|uniref:MarR family winged helix-turn-helix transcriptional regulator n=1 Tax=Bacillus sp. JCM 19041 TaxID=1460637 RepID=UPI0006CF7E63